MPRLEAASISITSTDPPAAISLQLEHTPQGWFVGPLTQFRQRATPRAPAGRDFLAARAHAAGLVRGAVHAVQAARQDARHGGLAGSALAREYVAVRDAVLRDGVFERGLDVLLIHHVGERLGPVFPGDDLVHGWANARPRVIRGTQVKPLPLLPSGPGGVCGRLSHGARDLTIDYRIMQPLVILHNDA